MEVGGQRQMIKYSSSLFKIHKSFDMYYKYVYPIGKAYVPTIIIFPLIDLIFDMMQHYVILR